MKCEKTTTSTDVIVQFRIDLIGLTMRNHDVRMTERPMAFVCSLKRRAADCFMHAPKGSIIIWPIILARSRVHFSQVKHRIRQRERKMDAIYRICADSNCCGTHQNIKKLIINSGIYFIRLVQNHWKKYKKGGWMAFHSQLLNFNRTDSNAIFNIVFASIFTLWFQNQYPI